MLFQQDSATCPTTRTNMTLLQETFSGHVISRCGDINYPPRPYDLTSIDFILRLRERNHVYADKPPTLEHLKLNSRQLMAEIPPNMYQKVVENYLKRISTCNTSRGAHLNDVMFHTNFTVKREISFKKIFYMCFIYVYF